MPQEARSGSLGPTLAKNMADLNRRVPHVETDRFSMVPKAEIPRSTFVTTHEHKSTFDAAYLVPIHVDEVLPGDVHQGHATIFARLSTPLFPVMDNMWLETFYFFVPNRILWTNWVKMMGERTNPADSISYTVPQIVSPAGGWAAKTLYDYFGIPGVSQLTGGATVSVNALPLRAYNLIWNEWFRDENLQNIVPNNRGDGPDAQTDYTLLKRNKHHDYFTSALPWPLKGGTEVTMPLSGTANVLGIAAANPGNSTNSPTSGAPPVSLESDGTGVTDWVAYWNAQNQNIYVRADQALANNAKPVIYADLSTATGATINALRIAFQTQRLLERDARSGTRYTELLRAHFGVLPEDARLQRPEYIGGGKTSINTSAIAQTSATGLTGGSSPLGALGAAATAADQHSFSYHATEHGFIIGLAHVTADLTYQQGLHRMWTRLTRYDHYWPVFAFLGEQAIRNDELYVLGGTPSVWDSLPFGYQERWAEYRHRPSRISGLFRSNASGTIDPWHLAINFTSQPALNSTFITDNPPMARVLAAGAGAAGMQILFDSVFKIRTTRAMPMFSVPGNLDRF